MSRSTRAEILLREQQDRDVMSLFAASDDAELRTLASRVGRCLEAQAAQSGWRDKLEDVIRHGGGWSCKTTACSACRHRHHVRPHQTATYYRWVEMGADNTDCSMVTVSLARVANLDDVRELVVDTRRSLRDLRGRLAKGKKAWKALSVAGIVECDLLHDGDVPLLLSKRAAMIPSLPRIGEAEFEWLPHLHAAVHHQGIDRQELRHVLEQRYAGSCRVDVRRFYQHKLPGENAADIVGYGVKLECASSVGDLEEDEPWPTALQAQWWAALRRWRRGLEPLRVNLRPMGEKESKLRHDAEVGVELVEAMPCSFL